MTTDKKNKKPITTVKQIEALKSADKVRDERIGKGFGIRVYPSGKKVFFYSYDSPLTGKRRWMPLGEFPFTSFEKAGIAYADAFKVVKEGQDPLEAQQVAEQKRREAPTVTDLCVEYIERHAKPFKRSWAKDQRILNHDVIPAWGKRKAADIKKRDVVLLLEKIVNRGSGAMANNTFQVVRKMFNWATEKDILESSPCGGVKAPAPKNARDRVLKPEEIKTFWNNLDACAMSGEIRRALRFILLTAQRPGEVIGMHTSEIDGDWWTIPAERAKNGKAHRVPLTALAKSLIEESIFETKKARSLPLDGEYRGFIFPSPLTTKEQAIAGQALIVAVARNLEVIGIDKFTPHDLRRTAATFMAERGEMDEVIDAILNHAKKGVIKVYNQYRYDREKQMALEAWERKLKELIGTGEPGNVIPITKKRRLS